MTRTAPARRRRGFSIIELAVVVGVIGVIAAIAFPSYFRARLRTVRTQGMECLAKVQSLQEGYFVRNNTYTAQVTDLMPSGMQATDICKEMKGKKDFEYAIAVVPATVACPLATCYEITATPSGPQAEDGVLRLRYDYLGATPADRLIRQRVAASGTTTW